MDGERETITNPLLDWYDANRRDLPWRQTKDPYAIWVSEAMLQQTQVATVLPYYQRFMERFPNVQALANASEDVVLKAWEGLGYYSRARNLQAGAREVVQRFGGQVPDTPSEIRLLPGVGPYMAGAILSIAFDRPEPAIDGNVFRVVSRVLTLSHDIAKPAVRRVYEDIVRGWIPERRRGDFTQALMELGAMVCTPRTPKCGECPLKQICRARDNRPEDYPVKKAKSENPVEQLVAVVLRRDRQFLLRKRPASGLLAGLWEFPTTVVAEGDSAEQALEVACQLGMAERGSLKYHGRVRHAFSHKTWEVDVYSGTAGPAGEPGETGVWVAAEQVGVYALPAVQHKVLEMVTGEGTPLAEAAEKTIKPRRCRSSATN